MDSGEKINIVLKPKLYISPVLVARKLKNENDRPIIWFSNSQKEHEID